LVPRSPCPFLPSPREQRWVLFLREKRRWLPWVLRRVVAVVLEVVLGSGSGKQCDSRSSPIFSTLFTTPPVSASPVDLPAPTPLPTANEPMDGGGVLGPSDPPAMVDDSAGLPQTGGTGTDTKR
jgi:hypothetical protein